MHVKAFIMLNRCLVAGGYSCIQALPLRRTWVYAHVPINTQILANHIFEEYRPVIDEKQAVLPGEPVALSGESVTSSVEPATSSIEPATPAVEPGKPKKPKPTRYTEEEYWSRVVDLKLKSFKDHLLHKFTGYVMADGVSITVIRKNKKMLAAKAAKTADLKRKREELAQEQPAAQRARLANQPAPLSSYQQLSSLLYQQP
ncbi:hypothetical protein GGH96_001068, partial [Coemansia sp. RSA 1972]